ncbi:MAG: DEAD/DEAH box helicase [Verrucomicrobiales bacterium]
MSHPFSELGVPADLVKGLEELGIRQPTPIQREVIPFLLRSGADLIAQAQTGTGKTAAFGLPLLTKVDPGKARVQALVLAPTRELAKQIGKQLFRYTKYAERKIFAEVLCGGDKMDRQIAALRRPTQIVVATPGRLLDLLKKNALSLEAVREVVLDEADEMLSMGFKKQLREILELTKERRATWLFSATFPASLDDLIKESMTAGAKQVSVSPREVVNRDISHRFAICERSEKMEWIADYLRGVGERRGLMFCRTKAGSMALGKQLAGRGFAVEVLQGDMSQPERDKVMRAFKKERVQFLIATDVAARGIDVEGLSFVLHHQLPEQMEYYTHRSGRTGRAGKKGLSIVLLEPRERKRIKRIEHELGLHFSEWR